MVHMINMVAPIVLIDPGECKNHPGNFGLLPVSPLLQLLTHKK